MGLAVKVRDRMLKGQFVESNAPRHRDAICRPAFVSIDFPASWWSEAVGIDHLSQGFLVPLLVLHRCRIGLQLKPFDLACHRVDRSSGFPKLPAEGIQALL